MESLVTMTNQKQINEEVCTYMYDFESTAMIMTQDKFEADEIVMICLERFLRLPASKVESMYANDGIKGCRDYIAKSILTSVKSDTSDYHYSIKKDTKDNIEDVAPDVLNNRPDNMTHESNEYDILTTVLSKDIYWYNAELYKMHYLDGLSFSDICELTGLGRSHVVTTVNNTHAEVIDFSERRKLEAEKDDDFGILTVKEYKAKHMDYNTPELSYFQLLKIMTKYKGNNKEAAAFFNLSVKEIVTACNKWNIHITALSHITKDLLIDALYNNYGHTGRAATALDCKLSSMSYLLNKYNITKEFRNNLKQ